MIKKYRVFVPGAWDLFHIGHLNLLKRARSIASKMIVGVDTDNSIKERKGEFPIILFNDRITILKACSDVDKIISNQSGSLNVTQLAMLNIEVVVLGSDWENKNLISKKEAEEAGIRIQYLPYTKGINSTMIRNKIKEREASD